ncbi:hypothetical protein [Burkholderia territorii]|uniref:hypothetical protein n=1 Tax=Burkholderia territorii TaxID=1503055 RepID=UPI000A5D79FB|nr:hypothetical protein [Burkholderia territorii]
MAAQREALQRRIGGIGNDDTRYRTPQVYNASARTAPSNSRQVEGEEESGPG